LNKRIAHNTYMKRAFDSATCPNCQTYFDHLPVDGDEDGNAYVALEVTPCATCGVPLCGACSSFVCEHGETHCALHLTLVADGTASPLKACPVCLEQIAASEASEPQVACPDCGSVELVGEIFHGAREAETGYQDAQELYRCLVCGSRGPAEDALEVAAPARIEPQSERARAARQGVA
jgi:hypothetical protein